MIICGKATPLNSEPKVFCVHSRQPGDAPSPLDGRVIDPEDQRYEDCEIHLLQHLPDIGILCAPSQWRCSSPATASPIVGIQNSWSEMCKCRSAVHNQIGTCGSSSAELPVKIEDCIRGSIPYFLNYSAILSANQ